MGLHFELRLAFHFDMRNQGLVTFSPQMIQVKNNNPNGELCLSKYPAGFQLPATPLISLSPLAKPPPHQSVLNLTSRFPHSNPPPHTTATKMSNPTDLDSIFADLVPPTSGTPQPSSQPATGTSNTPLPTEADLFKDLENLTASTSLSRPVTPRLSRGPRKSTEVNRSVRFSEEVQRENASPVQREREPVVREGVASPPQQQQGGGWLGGLWGAASAAVKQAEAAARSIQSSEEGQKLLSSAYSNIGSLRELGTTVTSRALPTVTNLLHTLAPPISEHEQLRIHLTHDLVGYPTLETVVFGVFERVMNQVEGGELMVVQRGSESRPRTSLPTFAAGPWWKANEKRSVGACEGVREGLKLAKAQVDEYARATLGEGAKAQDPSNPVRKSDIFLSIQACTFPADGLIPNIDSPPTTPEATTTPEPPLLAFALHLHDPTHNLTFQTLSQTLPSPWLLDLLDAPPAQDGGPYPDAIKVQLERGMMDPREWICEWVEEAVGLAVGVLAQRYVAKRMGGEEGAGLVAGKATVGGGEEARAGAI